MSFQSDFYPESRFGGFTNIDGTIAFYTRVNALLTPASIVLDVGCGRGMYRSDPVKSRRDLRILRGKVGKVIGIDVSPAGKDNPCLDEFRQIEGEHWPIEDGSIDLVICDNVLEHLEKPETFFIESNRVLRKGGVISLRTANSWNYIALISRLIPNKFHSKVTSFVQAGRKEEDVFPTYYRCNSVKKISSMLKIHGFTQQAVYGYEAEPSYLSFSRLAYWLGVVHQKIAPNRLRATVIAFGRKGDAIA
jgi:SAM-dependent methyltransferase